MKYSRALRSVLLAQLLLLGGCLSLGVGSPETRFYVLDVAAAAPAELIGSAPVAIGLGPLLLPDELNRPQIVSRDATHHLQLAEFEHWAGQLEGNVLRVMAERLMARLPDSRVYLHPWSNSQEPEMQVRLSVFRFDGETGGATVLRGAVSLIDYGQRKEALYIPFDLRDAAADVSMSALVASYSRLVVQLADLVAAQVATASMQAR